MNPSNINPVNFKALPELPNDIWEPHARRIKMYFKTVHDVYKLKFITYKTYRALINAAGYGVFMDIVWPMDVYRFFDTRKDRIGVEHKERIQAQFEEDFGWYKEIETVVSPHR